MKPTYLIMVILFSLITICSCSPTSSTHTSKKKHYTLMTSEEMRKECFESAGNDLNLVSRCLDNKVEAMKKLHENLKNTDSPIDAIRALNEHQKCFEKVANSEGKVDPVKAAECLGLGKPFNAI